MWNIKWIEFTRELIQQIQWYVHIYQPVLYGKFLSGPKLGWIQNSPSPRLVARQRLKNSIYFTSWLYLGWGENRWMELEQNETQIATSMIRTPVAGHRFHFI